MTYSVAPDPYTASQHEAAVPDDGQHPVVLKRMDYRGDDLRCAVLVKAPTSSLYGIRPCLRLVRSDGSKWVHR